MNPRVARGNVFEPVGRAVSDTWLQVRAKPVVFILIWLTLVLLPYIVLGLAFSGPVWSAIEDISTVEPPLPDSNGAAVQLPANFLADMAGPMSRFFGWYGIFAVLNVMVAIYTGSVLFGTVRRFRNRTFPKYLEALTDGLHRFLGFLKAVLYAAWTILWRPVAVNIAGLILAFGLKSPMLSTAGFFVGFFLFFSGLYRYGLGPFVHLGLDVPAKEACRISRAYHATHKPEISALFMSAVILPFLFIMLLFSALFASMSASGGLAGVGAFLLWVVWSVIQFIMMMTLLNFSMNEITSPTPDTE